MASLNLLVLRVSDLEKAVEFYSLFGFKFEKHSHGKGPEHYGVAIGSVIFELYPLIEESTTGLRIGFTVQNITPLLERLVLAGAKTISSPKESPWGLRAVIMDPFGHKVELIETVSLPCTEEY